MRHGSRCRLAATSARHSSWHREGVIFLHRRRQLPELGVAASDRHRVRGFPDLAAGERWRSEGDVYAEARRRYMLVLWVWSRQTAAPMLRRARLAWEASSRRGKLYPD